ncbi:MAG: response regulator transcription factor, partial [Lachnospiraceae bacterium]|nr:response regulator transcription factor [Lachnospiraceae bacterium]
MTKKRVLIADDFLMSRQVFEKAIEEAEDLELAGSFPSAEEAVDFTRNKYADLVILDIVMTEGMNGLSAAKRIKDIRPETKVIMVTSMPEVSYMERAKETGVESFWYKEVQEQPIIDLIRRTLDGESIYPENAPVVNLGNALSTEFT